jgi:L-amino acid N-acyltransferase YncA
MTDNDYNEIKKWQYQTLFYNNEYKNDFFNNIDENIIINNTECFLFFHESTKKIFWTSKSINSLISLLKDSLNKTKEDFQLQIASDENINNDLENLIPTLKKIGGKVTFHNVGYKCNDLKILKDLEGICDYEDNLRESIIKITYDSLGKEKFGMSEKEIAEFAKDTNNKIFISKTSNVVNGVIYTTIYNNGNSIFIRGLAVDNIYRGLGLSKKLLSKAFDYAKNKGVINSMLWVEKDNTVAINLYEKFNYVPYGEEEVTVKFN